MFLAFKTGNPAQLPLPASMTPKAITLALAAAQALFLPIDGQPSDDNLVHLSNAILPILLKATYDRIIGVYYLWGLGLVSSSIWPAISAMTRQSTRKLLALTAFAPKPPGPL
jgi:hypothetical protein